MGVLEQVLATYAAYSHGQPQEVLGSNVPAFSTTIASSHKFIMKHQSSMHTNSILVKRLQRAPFSYTSILLVTANAMWYPIQNQKSQDKPVCRTPTLTPPKYVHILEP